MITSPSGNMITVKGDFSVIVILAAGLLELVFSDD
jgi:hypothetical protein